jgi:NTE family protein
VSATTDTSPVPEQPTQPQQSLQSLYPKRYGKKYQVENRPKIGVVLSGGGAKGIAHIGILAMLEKLNIPIDYIVGTSMGSIVAGLYAYGYTAAQIDTIFRYADWNELLSDHQDRRYAYLIEKNTNDRYELNLTFDKKIITMLPSSFISGQNIENMLYTLTAFSYKYKTFDDLPVPFRCVGTDLISGEQYVFRDGSMAQAMRASMAVPGVFKSVLVRDTMLIVDGGVVNNFPVDIVKEMGADIVIGVDVGFSYSSDVESYNLAKTVEAAVFIASRDKTSKHREMCDVLIRPNTGKWGSASFSRADSLLDVGYQEAEKAFPQLKEIADKMLQYKPVNKERTHIPIGTHDREASVIISKVEYKGLKHYTRSYASRSMQIKEGKPNTIWAISEGIKRLYGTLVFDKVEFNLINDPDEPDKVILEVSVVENPTNELKLGFRYNNDHKLSFLAGIVMRDFGSKNSRLVVETEISSIPDFSAEYLFMPAYSKENKKHTNYWLWRPSLGFRYRFSALTSKLYHNEDNLREASMDFSLQKHSVRLFANSNWSGNILGLGCDLDYVRTRNTEVDNKTRDKWYVSPYFSFEHNNYNLRYYPTSGWKMIFSTKYVYGFGGHEEKDVAKNFMTAYVHIEGVASTPNKRLSFYMGMTAASIFFQDKYNIPLAYRFYQGGQSWLSSFSVSPLPGLPLTSSDGSLLWNATMNIQVRVIKNLYVSLRGGVGETENDFKDFFYIKNLLYGGNIGVSYKTPIGPVGISFQASNRMPFGVFLNIFYWY